MSMSGAGVGCISVPEGLKALAIVLLCDGSELVNAPLIDKVLEARLLAVVSPAVVPLSGHDGFNGMENIISRHKSERFGQTREGAAVPADPGSNPTRHMPWLSGHNGFFGMENINSRHKSQRFGHTGEGAAVPADPGSNPTRHASSDLCDFFRGGKDKPA
jgi:hypothetical protein